MPSLCVRNYSNDFSLFDSYCIERIWWKQRSLIDVFSMPTTPRRMIRTSNPIRRRRCSKKNDLASRHPRQLAFFFLPFLLVFLLLSLSLSSLFHFSLFFALIRLSCFFVSSLAIFFPFNPFRWPFISFFYFCLIYLVFVFFYSYFYLDNFFPPFFGLIDFKKNSFFLLFFIVYLFFDS